MNRSILPRSAPVAVGQRVHSILYGGRDGVISAIMGEQRPSSVSGGAVMVMGGSAEFDVVWSDGSVSRRLPEALVRGSVQWRVYDDAINAEAVAAELAKAALKVVADRIKADKDAADAMAANAAALAGGAALGLIPVFKFQDEGLRGRPAAWNLRKHLKANGIKARVSVSPGGYSLNVKVADADVDAAKAIAGLYKAGSFNGMSDSYEYDEGAWARVYGSMQYVWVSSVE